MGRSKKTVKNNKSFTKTIEIGSIFHNESANFFIGFVFLAIAVYLIFSFISFFTTGTADQTMIETPRTGDMLNENGEFQNSCGSIGAYVSYFFIRQCFGLSSFLVPIFLLLASFNMMRIYDVKLWKWFFCMAIIMIWSSVTMAKFLSPFFGNCFFNPGGNHGMFVCQRIEGFIGAPGLVVILASTAIAFMMYLSVETIYFIRMLLNPKHYLKKIPFTVNDGTQDTVANNEQGSITTDIESPVFDDPTTQVVAFSSVDSEESTVINDTIETEYDIDDVPSEIEVAQDKSDEITIDIVNNPEEEEASGNNLVPVGEKMLSPYDPKKDLENYRYPTLDLLDKHENGGKSYIDMEEQNANKNRIVDVLRTFGVEINSIKATVGPTITLYEITLKEGVRISKVRSLEDDIALSLAALGIRIIAPIPGKGTIGIEVPNAKPNIVSMESILNSKKFQETTMALPCAIGKTITNEVYMFDLAKMPHLLVAGATGQGKSVGLNAIITSLLYKKHPAEMKIVLIDPKKVEFSIYSNIERHFLAKIADEDADPIITDVTKVVNTLNSLCKEMDNRYDLLKMAGVRNIKEYNAKFTARQLNPEHGHNYMPYIVVIVDEFGDLIMTAGKEIELPIARIAQLARAVGIHMIIATQRPTTNIITGTIKANFPGRMAFKVSAGIDSKTILDRMGAQQLIGRGDMLMINGTEPVRVQCAFVDTPEVERICKYISGQQSYPTPFELPEPDVEGSESGGGDVDLGNLDPMFEDAARLIVTSQSGSTSLIQRKFSIGYNRAGRLMDQLEKAGIVGQARGAKPREVLIQDEVSLANLIMTIRKI